MDLTTAWKETARLVSVKHASVSCPTCKQPVVSEAQVGISINEIASLGAQLVQLRAAKPSALVDLRVKEIHDRLQELGAHVDEEGWVRSKRGAEDTQ